MKREKWFAEIDSLLGTIKIKADNAAHTPIAIIATPVGNGWLENPRWRQAAYDKAGLIAASPELLEALQNLVETFDYEQQEIYSFAADKIDFAKAIIAKALKEESHVQ